MHCENRLTIIGREKELDSLASRWQRRLGARHTELLECTATRNVWAFDTDSPPLEPLKRMSVRWPALTFLLEYDQRNKRMKGLVKARQGKLWHTRVTY